VAPEVQSWSGVRYHFVQIFSLEYVHLTPRHSTLDDAGVKKGSLVDTIGKITKCTGTYR
jgi:hypothetical protein